MKASAAIAGALVTALIGSAQAATLTVTNTNDNLVGSLRQAISDAASSDTIVFNIPTSDAGYNPTTHVFTISITGGELLIARDLTVDGGANKITVERTVVANMRIFDVTAGVVTLANLTIANGNPSSTSLSGKGAGIYNAGTLSLTGCTLTGNLAMGGGGAIYNAPGAVVAINNCTLQNNSAGNYGRAIRNDGTLTLTNSTVSGNSGGVNGGSVENTGTAHVRNTVIAANGDPDIFGPFVSDGFNFIGIQDAHGSGFGNPGSHDQVGTDASPANPQLSRLLDNGGPTKTMAPLAVSPLIDQGDSGGVTSDQRGFRRPVDQPGINNAGNGSDIGAFELGIVQSGPTFTVTTTDEHSDGVCEEQDCTLWDAANASNANTANNSVITFAPGVIGTIDVTIQPAGIILIRPVNIVGPGARLLTLSAANAGRIFFLQTAGVGISGLTIANGNIASHGGGIFMDTGT
ncbi:MAG TPA: choice-of-anchor Q domain-containing protein, partial [Chthoniobacterales bacterium]